MCCSLFMMYSYIILPIILENNIIRRNRSYKTGNSERNAEVLRAAIAGKTTICCLADKETVQPFRTCPKEVANVNNVLSKSNN